MYQNIVMEKEKENTLELVVQKVNYMEVDMFNYIKTLALEMYKLPEKKPKSEQVYILYYFYFNIIIYN